MEQYKGDLMMFKAFNKRWAQFKPVDKAFTDCRMCFVVLRRMTDAELKRAVAGRNLIFYPSETSSVSQELEAKNIGYRIETMQAKARRYLYVCKNDQDDFLYDGTPRSTSKYSIDSEIESIETSQLDTKLGWVYNALAAWCEDQMTKNSSRAMPFDWNTHSGFVEYSFVCFVMDTNASDVEPNAKEIQSMDEKIVNAFYY